MNDSATIKVSALVQLLQELVEENFMEVLVQGELASYSTPASGHRYFTLKDSRAQLRCTMFRSHARSLRFQPAEGMEVVCRGRVSVYPQRGDLQLLVEGLEPVGVGSLQLAFEQLSLKLQNEGLFAPELKNALPKYPGRIGIVTSASGAALHDILTVLQRRSAGVSVLLRAVRVQGVGAAADISAAIAELNQEGSAEVLIVGRGGGSREDLWAFNEEIVARAIAASEIPIISAVGHEVDVTIADLVADLRAATPSAAAELVVQNRLELERHLDQLCFRLAGQVRSRIELLQSRLQGLLKRLRAPAESLELQKVKLQQLLIRLQQGMSTELSRKKQILAALCGELGSMSPTAVLERGYAIVLKADSHVVVQDQSQLKAGDGVTIKFSRGHADAIIREIAEDLDRERP